MATNLTRPVGDIFEYNGARLKIVKYDGTLGSNKCLTCYLNSLPEFKEARSCQIFRESGKVRHIFGYCGFLRTDGKHIIFVKQEDTVTKLNLTE